MESNRLKSVIPYDPYLLEQSRAKQLSRHAVKMGLATIMTTSGLSDLALDELTAQLEKCENLETEVGAKEYQQ